ncbi:MAG: peroxiredoxin [Nocardioidaceae bacterium]
MTVEIGRPAPDFELKDQHGQTVRLSDFRGQKAVVLIFYPYAFSGVCTGELCEVRDRLPQFESDDVQLLALSCDPMFSLRAFADRDGLSFPLLSDFWPHGEVARAFDNFDEKRGCANRSTFIVDKEGVLRWEVRNAMPEARDLEEYVAALKEIAA